MSRSAHVTPRSAVGRADLLRALALADRDRLMLDADADGWFGYEWRPQPAGPAKKDEAPAIPPIRPPAEVAHGDYKLPLRMPFVHAIVERERRQAPEGESQKPEVPEHVAPIDEAAAAAPSDQRLVAYEDLVPQARLMPALRRHLGATRAGSLDMERIIQRVAARDLPRHLPRRRLQRWHPELVVVLDFCPRLWPYREDMHRLAERLLRHCGRSGVSLRIVNHGPLGPWSDWVAHQNPRLTRLPPDRAWSMPAAGTPVLIVSDFGLLLGPDSKVCDAWGTFIEGLKRAQIRPIALAPLGSGQLDARLTKKLPVLRWSPDARLKPVGHHGAGRPRPDGLDDLLAMAAATRRVDPPLLRAMRRLNAHAPLDAGLEGALWCHPDVEAGSAASIRVEVQDGHLDRFSRLMPRLQRDVDRLRTKHHAHLRAVLNHEETLLWHANVDQENKDSPELRRRVEGALDFMRRLEATLGEAADFRAAGVWSEVARRIEQRADRRMVRTYGDVLTPLVAARVRWATALGVQPTVPEWVDPKALSDRLGEGRDPQRCWLVRDAASASLLLQAAPPGPRQSPLGEPLLLDAGGARLRVGEGTPPRWLSPGMLPLSLLSLSEPEPLRLETAHETLVVAAVDRPRGAGGWECDGRGLSVRSARLGVLGFEWRASRLRVSPPPSTGLPPRKWALASEASDDAHVRPFMGAPKALAVRLRS